jgi:hypothetical protein
MFYEYARISVVLAAAVLLTGCSQAEQSPDAIVPQAALESEGTQVAPISEANLLARAAPRAPEEALFSPRKASKTPAGLNESVIKERKQKEVVANRVAAKKRRAVAKAKEATKKGAAVKKVNAQWHAAKHIRYTAKRARKAPLTPKQAAQDRLKKKLIKVIPAGAATPAGVSGGGVKRAQKTGGVKRAAQKRLKKLIKVVPGSRKPSPVASCKKHPSCLHGAEVNPDCTCKCLHGFSGKACQKCMPTCTGPQYSALPSFRIRVSDAPPSCQCGCAKGFSDLAPYEGWPDCALQVKVNGKATGTLKVTAGRPIALVVNLIGKGPKGTPNRPKKGDMVVAVKGGTAMAVQLADAVEPARWHAGMAAAVCGAEQWPEVSCGASSRSSLRVRRVGVYDLYFLRWNGKDASGVEDLGYSKVAVKLPLQLAVTSPKKRANKKRSEKKAKLAKRKRAERNAKKSESIKKKGKKKHRVLTPAQLACKHSMRNRKGKKVGKPKRVAKGNKALQHARKGKMHKRRLACEKRFTEKARKVKWQVAAAKAAAKSTAAIEAKKWRCIAACKSGNECVKACNASYSNRSGVLLRKISKRRADKVQGVPAAAKPEVPARSTPAKPTAKKPTPAKPKHPTPAKPTVKKPKPAKPKPSTGKSPKTATGLPKTATAAQPGRKAAKKVAKKVAKATKVHKLAYIGKARVAAALKSMGGKKGKKAPAKKKPSIVPPVHKSDKSEKEGAARPAKVDPVLRDPAMLGHHGSAFVGGVEATENMKKEMRGAP